jgi:cellobiose epimerase
MTEIEQLKDIRERVRKNATDCIFPFWTGGMLLDEENGGFYGKVTLDMQIIKEEPRALVLHGRMTYAFSNAYLAFGDKIYLDRAKRTFDYMMRYFYDKENGGAYNTVSYRGEVLDDTKPTYAEAFLIMAAAAYYRASKDPEAYRVGMETFGIMESRVKSGKAVYQMGFVRDWSAPAEMTFGGKKFSFGPPGAVMFQHHLCQAYEQLYRATGDAKVGAALREFAEYIADTLFDPQYDCFKGMLDANGNRVGTRQSFGHDCEIGYLAWDIANLVGGAALIAKMKNVCIRVLTRVREKDIDRYGSVINGGDLETGEVEPTRVWWVEAEGVTAMLCGYQLTGEKAFLDACGGVLKYIETYFVNKKDGDWYNNVLVDETGGHIVDGMHGFDKVNGGKCPFHNSHMCFDVMRRADEILGNGEKK